MNAVTAAVLILLSGCASVKEIAQVSIDQFAVRETDSPEVLAEFILPLAGFGTRELAESLQDLGRAVARRARPFAQIELTIATTDEEHFALEQIETGIRDTGWAPEALTYPHRVIVDPFARPFVRVIEGLPALSNHERELMIKASRYPYPL